MESWTRLLASTSIYTLEVPCFLGCLPQLREFSVLLGQVSTRPGDEVDAGPRRGEHPAVVVERPHLPLQRLHHLRLEFSHGLVLAVQRVDEIGDVFGG